MDKLILGPGTQNHPGARRRDLETLWQEGATGQVQVARW